MPAAPSLLHFELTRESQASFAHLCRIVAATFRKSLDKLIYQTAGMYLQSARKLTPVGKKSRRVRKLSKRDIEEQFSKFGARLPFAVGVMSNKPDRPRYQLRWYLHKSKAERKAVIPSRGAGRASWAGMFARLGHPQSEPSYRGTRAYYANVVTRKGGKSEPRPQIAMENKLAYIGKAVPNIAGQALLKAQTRLAHTYLRRMSGDAIAEARRQIA